MSLSDSLTPDRSLGQQQDRTAFEPAATLTLTERLFARADRAVNGEFEGIFGAGGPDARASLEGAAATEGRAAYTRFRAEPDAFGTVVGNRERADTVGGALEALNYSKAVHVAQQAGLPPIVPGYGVPANASRPSSDAAPAVRENSETVASARSQGEVQGQHQTVELGRDVARYYMPAFSSWTPTSQYASHSGASPAYHYASDQRTRQAETGRTSAWETRA